MARQRLYFMHPVNTYGTRLESNLLNRLYLLFSGWEIVNPNQPEHEAAYQLLKRDGGDPMEYFVKLALSCQGGVALSFVDGMFGAGVARECRTLAEARCPLWKITHRGALTGLSVAKLRESTLSVEETRRRLRHSDGSTRDFFCSV